MKNSQQHKGRSSLHKFKLYYEDLPTEELSAKFMAASEKQHRK